MPPLDENGIPKYKGKKRGRKPKPRKRKANPNRRKRGHTGYTMYMQENYPAIKEANPHFLASKDIIAVLAKQWAELSPSEKLGWKARAVATHNEAEGLDGEVAADAAAAAAVDDDDDDEDDDDVEDDDDDEPAPPARRSRRERKS